MNVLYVLLILAPVALFSHYMGGPALLTFTAAVVSIVPLAVILGQSTEALASRAGANVGGLINSTLGNAAELIITIFAIRAGLLELAKASITGSILGNLLLVMGASLLVGGLRHGIQKFDRTQAGLNATMLMLAAIALGVPSLFSHAIEVKSHDTVEYLSLGVAGAMLLVYALSQWFLFRNGGQKAVFYAPGPTWPLWKIWGSLILSTALIAWLSEALVHAVKPVLEHLGWTEFFIGIIVIPLVGNVAEHLVAVQVAAKNEMDLSMSITVGSSLQIALFVAPVLVFFSLAMANPLTLVFNPFELAALIAASLIAGLISLDGETNWMEGVQLLIVYLILALAFFFLPTG